MSRWRLIILSAAVAVVCTAGTFVVAAVITWDFAVSTQRNQIDLDAKAALARVEKVYLDAANTLRQIASDEDEPCSPTHIREMLQLTEASRIVVNIGYGAADLVECNSWGRLTYLLKKSVAVKHMPDGIGVVPNWRPQSFGTDRSMLILRQGGYSALVDQRSFYSDLGSPSGSLLDSVSLADGTRLLASYAAVETPRSAVSRDVRSTVRGGGWQVTVRRSAITFSDYLHSQRVLLALLLVALALLYALLTLLWLRHRLSTAGEFYAALRRREITAHYQPVIELATGRCVGAEALARWLRADGSQVPPDVFVPLAERAGLIAMLREQIVAAVTRDLGRWLMSNAEAHISINLSASELTSGTILQEFDEAFRAAGIDCGQIWLEVTETGIIDIQEARPTLAELRRRGHRLAIDDFGTGYSGLSYLQQLKVDVLKVDRCFVEVIGSDAATRYVAELVISLAHQLELDVVAEGVETEVQAAYLRDQGVEYAQGWLFSRPLPAEAFLAFWSNQRPQSVAS